MKKFKKILRRLLIVFGVIAAIFVIWFIVEIVIAGSKISGKKKTYSDQISEIERGLGTEPKTETKEETKKDPKTPRLTPEELTAKYTKLFELADDDLDFMWANDYQKLKTLHRIYITDSKAYESVFGYRKPTKKDLEDAIDSNINLTEKYKKFFKEFIGDWLSLYPESDFTPFKQNIATLKVEELTSEQIIMRAMSSGTVACYISSENVICINKESDITDKTSSDYIVLVHELLHAARGTKTQIGENHVKVEFFDSYDMGLYEDESMASYFPYQLQGLNNKSIFYTLQSNYYRMILDVIDYDGNDYMNHSVNYLIYKMDEAFKEIGVKIPAYYMVNLIDSQAVGHYKTYATPDYSDYHELYEAIVQIYCYKHLTEEMDYEQAMKEFDTFWEEVTFNFENLKDPYPDMTKECYMPYWEAYCKEHYKNN